MDKLQEFKTHYAEAVKAFNEKMSYQELKSAIQTLIDFVKKQKEMTAQEMQAMKVMMSSAIAKMESDQSVEMEKGKKEMMAMCEKEMNKMMMEHEAMMSAMDKKMDEVKDGRDSDPQEVALLSSKIAITEVLKQIPPPDTAQQVLDKVISLDGENGLRIEDIYELRKELDELRQLKGTRTFGGGGLSASAMNLHFSDFYTPTGDVNGVNTDFVLTNTPSPASSLEVYLQGQLQDLTTNYTLSGKTITFLEAPITGNSIKVKHRV